MTHRYDDLDNTQLLLNYGFVAAEGALPASARLPLPLLFEAVAATRDNAVQLGQGEGHDMEEDGEDGGDASALIAEWDVGERWEDKTRACEKLLEMYGGAVSVSAEEPLPDALLTMVQLMLMPGDDFAEVLMGGGDEDQGEDQGEGEEGEESGEESGERGDGDGEGKATGGKHKAAWVTPEKIPLLDGSVVEGDPDFAAVVVDALLKAVELALLRYPAAAADGGGSGGGGSNAVGVGVRLGGVAVASDAAESRAAAAAVLVAAERNALGATRRAAVRMMLAAESAAEEGEDFDDFDEPDLRALCTASKRRFGETDGEAEAEDGEDEDGEEDGEEDGDEVGGQSAGKKKKKAKCS